MLALIQPFSLAGAGGGPRILRSLVEEAPVPYLSVYASPFPEEAPGPNEYRIARRPYFGTWPERLSRHLGNVLEYTTVWSQHRFETALADTLRRHEATAVHTIPQGLEYWSAYRVARRLGLPFFLSVHDELAYNLQAFPYRERAVRHLATVWRDADARFVISEAMGEEYNRRYGVRPFSIVTDGVRDVADAPATRPAHRLRVYFMGSVHLAYEANFHVLIRALERLQAQAPALEVSFTLRGGCPFDLPDTSLPVTRRGWGTQADVERDMAEADLLYFPLPFEDEFEAFVRYSLSTKMVSYLGSGLPILFHGPRASAAGTLLATHDAGLLAPTLCPDALAETLSTPRASLDGITRNALHLADTQFRIEEQRRRFWTPILDAMPSAAPAPLTPAAC